MCTFEFSGAAKTKLTRIVKHIKIRGNEKIARITEAAENEIQKKPITPDEYYDYLNLVAPKEGV